MRWTALVSKFVVAGAAGAFLAVSAAGAQPPRPVADTDPGRETPAGGPVATPRPAHGGSTEAPATAVPNPSRPSPR